MWCRTRKCLVLCCRLRADRSSPPLRSCVQKRWYKAAQIMSRHLLLTLGMSLVFTFTFSSYSLIFFHLWPNYLFICYSIYPFFFPFKSNLLSILFSLYVQSSRCSNYMLSSWRSRIFILLNRALHLTVKYPIFFVYYRRELPLNLHHIPLTYSIFFLFPPRLLHVCHTFYLAITTQELGISCRKTTRNRKNR